MSKNWKSFFLAFSLTLFFCGALAAAVEINQACQGFDGVDTGVMLAIAPGDTSVDVTVFSQQHTLSLEGMEGIRALWWQLYPLFPYPVKAGETLREWLFARLDQEAPKQEKPMETPPLPEDEEPYSSLFTRSEIRQLEDQRHSREYAQLYGLAPSQN